VALLAKDQEPHLRRKGLPGDPETFTADPIEAIVKGIVIGGLQLPNGNPYPGPKFDYKLRWFERLHDYAAELLALEVPVVFAAIITSCQGVRRLQARALGERHIVPCRGP
jgi:exodeoxyribonuclease-3